MHYQLEIILPPTADLQKSISEIMARFSENEHDDDGNSNPYSFWDFYVIGGRWSGAKLEAMLDVEKLNAFRQELSNREVTVNGFTSGKEELLPADQIPMVDALWREFFPESPIKTCPLFRHFNDQYKNSDGFPDVMELKDMPARLTASRVIIVGPHWDDANMLETKFMIQDSMWNGITWVDAKWDGNVNVALAQYRDSMTHWNPEYAAKCSPQDDWLVVTIDYHS